MKIEALNCPNCGAGVASDRTLCEYCNSRLKTMACPACFGLLFIGAQHCSHCGAKTVVPEIIPEDRLGDCPRCRKRLDALIVGAVAMRECARCDGVWADAETFENICADNEKQSAVLGLLAMREARDKSGDVVRYVPCPDCQNLMNRHNFAGSSGVIVDLCKRHGIWFDAEELPRIIEFIRRGGLAKAREKEKLQLQEQKRALIEQQRQLERENARFGQTFPATQSPSTILVRQFVRFLFDK
ncbi:MAG: zf-TFIIB domain-containing protein [Acidobacteria bacterium]|nr:zf-TFIIB domain-containing protein [Acidobacteriota bacterium]